MAQSTLIHLMDTIVAVLRNHRDPRSFEDILRDRLNAPYRDEMIAKVHGEIQDGWELEGIYPESSAELRKLVTEALNTEPDDDDWSTAMRQLKEDGTLFQFGPGRGRALALWRDSAASPAEDPAGARFEVGSAILDRVGGEVGDSAGGGGVLHSKPTGEWIHRTREIIQGVHQDALADLHERLQYISTELLNVRNEVGGQALDNMLTVASRIQALNEELASAKKEFSILEQLVLAQAALEALV